MSLSAAFLLRTFSALHDRMLFHSELVGVLLTQSAHDGDRRQLRLCEEVDVEP
jgi:hypothetical protein